jgi:isopenicillin N synthase-like dioxygenase
MQVAGRFFSLPETERHAIAIGNSPHFRGYTVLGDEMTAGRNDWRDQLDVGPEEPALSLQPGDPAWLRLRGPNQWPQRLPEMQETVVSWMAAIEPVALSLIHALALGLGQPASYFDNTMTPRPYTRVKIVRYPALPAGTQDGQGLGLHHDSGLFTFILQDDVPGLQVENNGRLLEVEPVSGAYVVNLGEMFQAASNGYLRATKHRVVSPPSGKERISIAYFMNPRLDAVFEPIDLPPELAKLAPGAQNADPDDPVHRTFGDNTLKTRMRAHPDVVQ